MSSRRARLIEKEIFGGMLYKTYRLIDGRKLVVRHKGNGSPATWMVEGETRIHRMITDAAQQRLGRILTAGEVLPQRIRTRYEIRPIPQVTPPHILDQLLNPPVDK